MIAALTLFVAVAVDPRPALVDLQLKKKTRDALVLVQRELADRPDAARPMGLDYLRGHLLHLLGDAPLASEAFGAALAGAPDLSLYSKYRMALGQEEMGHPEVAAGLVAGVVAAAGTNSPLLPDAVRLFTRTLARGGDCRLLRRLTPEKLPAPQRRWLLLAEADCALQRGTQDLARNLLLKLLEENRQDDPGRAAAERLAGLVSEAERGRAPMLLGQTFQLHCDFERALRLLRRVLLGSRTLSEQEAQETVLSQARVQLAQQRYAPAAALFGDLAQRARSLPDRAQALYQQGRAYELEGRWPEAAASFDLAYRADPPGEWGAQSLLSKLRLLWRGNEEAEAATLFYTLDSRPQWKQATLRAGLFLAASDIVRSRGDRAKAWLDRLVPGTDDERLEIAYWRGRLAELDKEPADAVASYLDVLRADPWHPLSRLALARLATEPLAHAAAQEGRRLAGAKRPQDLYGAWLLLGNRDETGQTARRRLRQLLLADRATAPFVRLSEVPIAGWPLWKKPLLRPEDKLLALGLWHEGAPAVRDNFPVAEPALGLTGSLLLDRGGEHARSIRQAEELRRRAPARVPLAIQPRALHVVLYPYAYRDILLAQGRLRGVDPGLLAALIREESRFDETYLSPAAARGLTQLTLPAAKRIAGAIDLRVEPDDLYRPEVSTALGAAGLGLLLRDLNGLDYMAVAAYTAGEPQALLWRTYCYGAQLDEYYTKIGFPETRDYVRRVLTSRAHYAELY